MRLVRVDRIGMADGVVEQRLSGVVQPLRRQRDLAQVASFEQADQGGCGRDGLHLLKVIEEL